MNWMEIRIKRDSTNGHLRALKKNIYIGIRIYIGLHQENRLTYYWNRKDFSPLYPIAELMGLKRFKSIHQRIRIAPEISFKSVFNRVNYAFY